MDSTNQEPDYYAVLHLSRTCTQDEIRDQFKRMVKVFHPDHHRGDIWHEKQLRLCNQAYEVLGDPKSRAAYDARFKVPVDSDSVFTFNGAADQGRTDAWTHVSPEMPKVDEPWVFTPVLSEPESEPLESVFESFEPAPEPVSTVSFGDGHAGPKWSAAIQHAPLPKKKRTATRVLVITAIAAFAIAGFVVLTTSDAPVRGLPSISSSLNTDTDYAAAETQAASPTLAPTQNLQQATDDAQAASVRTRQLIAPYWTRYVRDEHTADHAEGYAINHAPASRQDEVNYDSQALDETATELQDEFDDLSYGAVNSDDADSTKSELDTKLRAYEAQILAISSLSPRPDLTRTHIRVAAYIAPKPFLTSGSVIVDSPPVQ